MFDSLQHSSVVPFSVSGHFDQHYIVSMQADADILCPFLRFSWPSVAIDGMCPPFDRVFCRKVCCRLDCNQGVGWQYAPLSRIAVNSLTGRACHLHEVPLV
jgi:hypothetical protein